MTLNGSNEKKTRKKRAIRLVDGVVGNEISIYFKDLKEPEIKITFLQLEKDIYRNYIKLFIRKDVKDLEVKNFLDWVRIELELQSVEKVNEIYQIVQSLLIPEVNKHYHVRNFNHRRLVLNPLYQCRLPHPNYKEYIKGE